MLMSEELLISGCAPTLAGLKTANLICCPMLSRQQALEEIRELNHSLCRKDLCLLPLRYMGDRVLLYLFRPRWLQRDLRREDSARLLRELGYPADAEWRSCLRELMQRLQAGGNFPHEIGLFLGYPPDDVRGFIEHRAASFKFSGCWKVYGDEDMARKLFARYQACTRCYAQAWRRGRTLMQLAVAAG